MAMGWQGEGQCCCVGLGLWPHSEGLWGSGIFGFGFVPTNEMGQLLGHIKLSPQAVSSSRGLVGRDTCSSCFTFSML